MEHSSDKIAHIMIANNHNLACPIDALKLKGNDHQLSCANGHCFDIARQGYVNLLPVQYKRSKNPGDSKAMVRARRDFLNSGIYQTLADNLCEQVISLLQDKVNESFTVFDAGCGEGYYLEYLYQFIKREKPDIDGSYIGLDISKDAILQATKRNKNINWVVGTNRKPPVLANSVDIVLCLFGFADYPAFSEILKADGKIIMVDPGVRHLQELRKIIYKEVRQSGEDLEKDGLDKSGLEKYNREEKLFSVTNKTNVCYQARLSDNQQINNLLLMTPHFFRADTEGKKHACSLEQLEISIDVQFRVLGRL